MILSGDAGFTGGTRLAEPAAGRLDAILVSERFVDGFVGVIQTFTLVVAVR